MCSKLNLTSITAHWVNFFCSNCCFQYLELAFMVEFRTTPNRPDIYSTCLLSGNVNTCILTGVEPACEEWSLTTTHTIRVSRKSLIQQVWRLSTGLVFVRHKTCRENCLAYTEHPMCSNSIRFLYDVSLLSSCDGYLKGEPWIFSPIQCNGKSITQAIHGKCAFHRVAWRMGG